MIKYFLDGQSLCLYKVVVGRTCAKMVGNVWFLIVISGPYIGSCAIQGIIPVDHAQFIFEGQKDIGNVLKTVAVG